MTFVVSIRALPACCGHRRLTGHPHGQAEAYVPTSQLCERLAQRTGNFSKVEFKDPNGRTAEAVAPPSSLARPNYSDMLKRGERAHDGCPP